MASIKKPLNLQFRNGGSENLSSSISSSDVLKFSAVSLVATAVLTACGPKADAAQESRPPLTILFPDLETQKLNGPPIAIYSFKNEEIPASQVDFLNKTYGGEPLSLDAWVSIKIGPVIETKNESGDGMVTFETYTLDNGKQIVAFPDKNENYSQGKSAEYFAGKFSDDKGIYYSYYIKDPADSSKIYSFVTVRWDNQDANKQALVENGANPNDVFGNPTTINVTNPLTKEEISYVPLTGQNVFFDMIGKIIEPSGVAQAQGLPTNTPEPTIPSVPMIEVGGLQIPDPKASNPELFDITNPDSPIVQFANAFGISPENVVAGLHAEIETPINGSPSFAVLRTSDGVALMTAQQGKNGEWKWQEATPGIYWGAQDKWTGFYIKSYHLKYLNNYLQLDKFADGGILALSGQANPNNEDGRDKPINARDYLKMAKDNNMSFDFNYVLEPGRFPDDVNSENVNQWLNTRLNDITEEINTNNPEQPVLLQLNEAWDTRSGNWNPDLNPLRDKYGEQWIEEYIYQSLNVSISKGLDVNSDFVLMFNENGMFNNPQKQRIVHDKLVEARMNAFNRLAADPIIATKLQEMGIIKAEDIKILMGTQMHIKLGEQGDGHIFMPEPSTDEINSLADLFGDLGGIIMTEVNPNGSEEQKAAFLSKITQVLTSNKNLHGFIIWNPVPDDENGQDIYKISPTFLFNVDGSPTQLFFELLRESASN